MSDVHDHVRSLMAAYAIGAVPDDEIPAIRAHILTCEECFAEAESFAETTAVLAEAVEPVALSAGFEDRVLQEVRGSRPAPAPRRRSWWRGRAVLVGAAAAIIAVLVFTTISFVTSMSREQQYQEVVAALIHDPDSFRLTGPGGAEAVVASTSEGSILAVADLGEAPEGRTYQLWLMKDGVPTPADTFDASGQIIAIDSSHDLEGFDGAAVTVEPEGGSKSPTTDPVLSTS